MEKDSCTTTEPDRASFTSDTAKTAGLGNLCALPKECIYKIFTDFTFANGYNPEIPASILKGVSGLRGFTNASHTSRNFVLAFIVDQLIADNPDIVDDSITQATPKAVAAVVVALRTIDRMQNSNKICCVEQHKKLQNFYQKHVEDVTRFISLLLDFNIQPHALPRHKPFGYMAEIAYCIKTGADIKKIWDKFLNSQKFIYDLKGLELLLCLGMDATQSPKPDFNCPYFHCPSPLYCAIQKGCLPAVELLLQFGADVAKVDNYYGYSSIIKYAEVCGKENRHPENATAIIDLLIKHGASE